MRQFIAVTIVGVVALAAMFLFDPVVEAQQLTTIKLLPQTIQPISCTPSNRGALYFASTTGQLQVCVSGTGWSNIDTASAQTIFKNIANSSGVTQFSALTNTDTLQFAAGGNAGSIAFDAVNKRVTFSATDTNSLGTVLDVTGSSPIFSTGGSAPNIPIQPAGQFQPGYLTMADWNAFNDKGYGTVTGVGATAPIASSGGTVPTISLNSGGVTFEHWASNSCAPGQVPQYNGATWGCASVAGSNNYTSAIAFSGGATKTLTLERDGLVPLTASFADIDTNSLGTVLDVTGSSPIFSTGGSAPNITIQPAGQFQPGYLTIADWNTFNNKGYGTVTSVGSGTGLTGGPITTAGTLSLNINGGVLQSCGGNDKVRAISGTGMVTCAADLDTDTNNYLIDAVFSGTGTKTLTLSRSGLAALTPTFTDIDTNSLGTVTSVGTGAGLTGGTITGAGTISLSINGGFGSSCSGQYVTGISATGIVSCGTPPPGVPGGATTNVQYNNFGVFAGSNNLVWNNGTTRLGIGTAAPNYTLDVAGDINFTGTLRQNGTAFSGSQWITSGSNIYYNSGNVGIGNINPVYALDVLRNQASQAYIRMQNLNPSGFTGFFAQSNVVSLTLEAIGSSEPTSGFLNTSRIKSTRDIVIDSTGYPIRFMNNLTEYMRIVPSAGGSIGIGDAAPEVKLSVIGNAAIGYSSGQTAPSNGLIVSGNVGIGTAGPGYKLEVTGGDIMVTSAGGSLIFGAGGSTVTKLSDSWGIAYPGDATHPFRITNASLLVGSYAGGANYGSGNVMASGNLIEKSVTPTPSVGGIGWYRITSSTSYQGGTVRIAGFYDNRSTDVEFQYNIGGYSVGGSIQQTRYSSYNNGFVSQARISSNGAGATYLDIYINSATVPGPVTIYGYGPNMSAFIASPVVGAVAGSTDVQVLTLGHGFRTTKGANFAETSGNVGIGTAGPNAKLELWNPYSSGVDSLRFGYNDSNAYWMGIQPYVVGGGNVGYKFRTNNIVTTVDAMAITGAGYVGIGTVSPGYKLDVNGTLGLNGDLTQYGGSYLNIAQWNAAYAVRVGEIYGNGGLYKASGNMQFDLGTVSSFLFSRLGTTRMSLTYNSVTGKDVLTIGSSGTGKIDGAILDPPYTIGGKRYATYGLAMTGLKEETTGVIRLQKSEIRNTKSEMPILSGILDKVGTNPKSQTPNGITETVYSYAIDFTSAETGSDLWLFAKTTNLARHFDQMTVLLTPAFDGRVWYETDPATMTLIVYGVPYQLTNLPTYQLVVSYRLTAPRFDSAEWPNTRPQDDVEGMNLDTLVK